jgi:hypothetical protein
LFLLGKTTSVFSFSCRKQTTGFAFQGGPNQTIEVGQFRLAKSPGLQVVFRQDV